MPPPEAPRVLEKKMGDVRRVLRPHATRDEKTEKLRSLRAEAEARGYRRGWADYKFRSIFGHWPRRGAA